MEFRRITVCHDCLVAFRQASAPKRLRLAGPIAQQWTKRHYNRAQAIDRRSFRPPQPQRKAEVEHRVVSEPEPEPAESAHSSPSDLQALHQRILDLSSSILRPDDSALPPEQRVLYVLENLHVLARSLVDARSIAGSFWRPGQSEQERTATSALLGSVNARKRGPQDVSKGLLLNLISVEAEEILRHAHVFITPAVLNCYVELQALLHRPSSFPEAFDLYARKPIPEAAAGRTSTDVAFRRPNPDKMNAAVDSKTANTALDAATKAHDLPLAIDIIDTAFCTPAFRKAKLLRQALVPILGIGIAPFAAYTLSAQFSAWQTTMDPGYATGIAFAGIATYIASVSSIGYVAITTANDQMDRVTWAQGVPLWERWVREDERAAIDKVAGAWGFQGAEKRGEEEGEEWESLREFVGLRGMVLDKVELMEGME